ncbi:MAG: hypothetical protein DWQ09_11245 [Proteobacteria bacterium]|nr:MAG: hypothetical protein DWQ09_11245 [Pseudomonadota bacterium]
MAVHPDVDPQETREWQNALEAVLEREGTERAHYLLEQLIDKARRSGAYLPCSARTACINTIPTNQEERNPGDRELERRIRSIIRWNATAKVVRANRKSSELGGHIASFASAATLYDVGFNHFFRAPNAEQAGDLVFIQGHSAPGIYARAYLEGRIDETQLERFRQEVAGGGLSSYPHPWLMPDFWQFSTVSMGLGPLTAIYQARFMKYLEHRGIIEASNHKVWAFMGDGEMDEPESLGAIALAGREGLDNLIFVINCNPQRLDGPVRGTGKIIQQLESDFRGAGWNAIKVIWGSYWDPLLARDTKGLLRRRMEEAVDGEYQKFRAKGGKYTREHFFGKFPELREMVANLTDEDIWRLNRGGHDPNEIYAAYAAAVKHTGQPTVILAKTVKGYGMGEAGEGQNITHQQKKLDDESLRHFRDRFRIPVTDDQTGAVPFYKPPADSPEIQHLQQSREKLGGYLPLLSFLMKAAVAALKRYESFTASRDPGGARLILKRYCHLGITVDTPNGLVMPVLRDVDQKGLWTLTEELAGISDKARVGKLSPMEMQGATFTVSSPGGIGGVAFTPIVNVPEVAILGASRAALKPSWRGGEFVPRLQLPLSLSYDHRVIDGAAAARFSAFLATLLGDIRRLLL